MIDLFRIWDFSEMDNHMCVFEDTAPFKMRYIPISDAPDNISIYFNLSDVPYPENTVAEMTCIVVSCYTEPLVTLEGDGEPLEQFEETGMDVHFAVNLERCTMNMNTNQGYQKKNVTPEYETITLTDNGNNKRPVKEEKVNLSMIVTKNML